MRSRIFTVSFTAFVTLIYVGLCSFGYAEKYFGASSSYEEGTSVTPLPGGGYLVSGAYNNTGNPANWKGYLLMLNGQGDTVWTKKNMAYSGKVKSTIDNKFIFIGGNTAGQAYDTIYVTKADLQGNVDWTKQIFYGVCHNTVTDVLALADGGFMLTGFYASDACSNPTYDAFIIKLDANGNTVWQKAIKGIMNEQLHVLKALPDGNYAAFGWTNSYNENLNVDNLLIKFDANGNDIWTKRYGNADDNYGYGMEVLPDGSFMMLGYTVNMELTKADADGTVQWKKAYGTAAGGTNFKVSYTTDGGLAILGSEMVNGQSEAVFMKTDLSGSILWKKNWGARLREFRENTDGSFVLTGYAHYLPDVAVILMDSTKLLSMPDTLMTNTPHQQAQRNNSSNNDTTTTGIANTETQEGGIRVYPNPADNILYIEFSNKDNASYRLEIYSITGQMVRVNDHITAGQIKIDRDDMVRGMYTYRLTGGGNTFAGKFVFQ